MPPSTTAGAFVRGLGLVVSVPSVVLFATALGFGALARDGGFDFGHAVFLSAIVFALPNQVVLIDQLMRGATFAGAALAVTLTAVRLMPMTVTLVPLFQGEQAAAAAGGAGRALHRHLDLDRGPPPAATHCPSTLRLPFHLGVGVAMACMMLSGTIAGYLLVAGVPALVTAALLFMTPLYFILSLIATSRSAMDMAAVAIGCGLSPVLYLAAAGLRPAGDRARRRHARLPRRPEAAEHGGAR